MREQRRGHPSLLKWIRPRCHAFGRSHIVETVRGVESFPARSNAMLTLEGWGRLTPWGSRSSSRWDRWWASGGHRPSLYDFLHLPTWLSPHHLYIVAHYPVRRPAHVPKIRSFRRRILLRRHGPSRRHNLERSRARLRLPVLADRQTPSMLTHLLKRGWGFGACYINVLGISS